MKKEKISITVFCFSAYMLTMLYQTGSSNRGTIFAFVTMVVTALSMVLCYRRLKFALFPGMLALSIFIVFNLFTSVVLSDGVDFKFFGLMLFVVLLSFFRMNQREKKYLENAFIFTAMFYGALILYACITNTSMYTHGSILLFGSELDPNFVGIPLVGGIVLLLYRLLYEKGKIFSALMMIFLLITVFYTASRGSFLSMSIGCALVALYYFFDRKIPFARRAIILVVGIVVFYAVFIYAIRELDDQMNRILDFSEGADNGRFGLWRRAIDVFSYHPLFGVGHGGYYRLTGMATHNTYLAILCETGLVGSLCFLIFLFAVLKKVWRLNKGWFFLLIAVLIQVFFLDATANRCLWSILAWFALCHQSVKVPE